MKTQRRRAKDDANSPKIASLYPPAVNGRKLLISSSSYLLSTRPIHLPICKKSINNFNSAAFGLDGEAVNYISIVVEIIFAVEMGFSKRKFEFTSNYRFLNRILGR
jgi:hypothetical protein